MDLFLLFVGSKRTWDAAFPSSTTGPGLRRHWWHAWLVLLVTSSPFAVFLSLSSGPRCPASWPVWIRRTVSLQDHQHPCRGAKGFPVAMLFVDCGSGMCKAGLARSTRLAVCSLSLFAVPDARHNGQCGQEGLLCRVLLVVDIPAGRRGRFS